MLAWFWENISTIIVGLVLAAAVIGIVVKVGKDKKKGKSSCGCGCSHCAMSGHCHGGK